MTEDPRGDNALRQLTAASTTGYVLASAVVTTERIDRRVTGIVLGLALFVALYTGFRVPNAWSATLQAVSITDGFHKRFVVGTLLRPLALATDYDYKLFATFSFLVLGALLAIVAINAWRTQLLEQRLLVIAWLVLPTGGFVFNEVGYFEQLLYLLLFTSIWLVARGKLAAATALMAITPCIHEIAILTVLPVYGFVLLRKVSPKHAVIATAIPALVNLIVLAIPAASSSAVETLAASLQHANFKFRVDALLLFNRSQSDNWGLYTVHDVVVYVRPIAYMLLALLVGLWFTDRHSWRTERDRLPGWLLLVTACAVVATTTLLVYGGWDGNRWRFLVITNFFVVLWFLLGERGRVPLRTGTISVLVLAVLLVSRLGFWYFDGLAPRELAYRPFVKFFIHAGDGSLFEMAKGE